MSSGLCTVGEYGAALGLSVGETAEMCQILLDRDQARAIAADAAMDRWGRGRWHTGVAVDRGTGEEVRLEARIPVNTFFHQMGHFAKELAEAENGQLLHEDYYEWLLKRNPQCRAKYVPNKTVVAVGQAGRKVIKRYED